MGQKKVLQLLAGASCLLGVSAIFVFAIRESVNTGSLLAVPYLVMAVFSTMLALLCLDVSRYQPADSLSIRAMWAQYMEFGSPAYVTGWFCNWRVRQKFQDCRATQEDTLKWIISLNKDTVYGRDHHLAGIKSGSDLVREHPLTYYSHYEAYTARVARGEQNVMAGHKPAILALSSGTTGKNKRYPFSMKSAARMLKPLQAAFYMNAKYHLKIGLKRVFEFRLFHPATLNEYGVREGGVGNVTVTPSIYNITPTCFLRTHLEPVNYLIQAVFALKEPELGLLDGFSSDLWYCFFKFISEHHVKICDIIESGEFSPFPGLTEELRLELTRMLSASPERAAALRPILSSKDVKGLARRVWPSLELIQSAKNGGFSHSAQLLQNSYTQGLMMFTSVHAATEAIIGIYYDDPLEDNIYVLATVCAFFEFIHVESIDDENPATLLIDQLEIGECYEVVVTNSDGLYRNRFGDVIKIVGYVGNTPKYTFMYRKGQTLNIAFDRTPETVFYNALEKTRQGWNDVDIVNYTTTESIHLDGIAVDLQSPAHYVIFMETVHNGAEAEISDDQAVELDESLRLHHQTYQEFREMKCIGPIRIIQVKRGTFDHLRYLLTGGKMSAQFKSPRVLRKPPALRLLWDSRLN